MRFIKSCNNCVYNNEEWFESNGKIVQRYKCAYDKVSYKQHNSPCNEFTPIEEYEEVHDVGC